MALKYFTYENRKRIEERLLNETDISGLPTLGHGVDFGVGEVCLEETKGNDNEDKFEFYFAVNYDKYQHQVFDNIEDAISALVEYYQEWKMIDKPNKMKKIICEELGLKHNIFNEFAVTKGSYDVDSFLNKYSVSKEMTPEELKSIMALVSTLMAINSKIDVLFDHGKGSSCDCLFKIDDDSWVVWDTDEKRGFHHPQNFDNVDDACASVLYSHFKNHWPFGGAAVTIYYEKRKENQSIELPELTAFANEYGYVFPKEKTRSKHLYIKK